MNLKKIKLEDFERIHWLEVIEEAVSLLRQIRFSAIEGGYLRGEHVAVSVHPRWNEDRKTIRVRIFCDPLGDRYVEWDRLPIFVYPEGEDAGLAGLVRLDQGGQGVFSRLKPAEYRLFAETQWGESGERIPIGVKTVEGARWSRTYSLQDESIQVTVAGTETGGFVVAGETREQHLAGATIQVSIFDPKISRIQYDVQLTLMPHPKKENRWIDRRVYEPGMAAAGNAESELVFVVLPPSKRV